MKIPPKDPSRAKNKLCASGCPKSPHSKSEIIFTRIYSISIQKNGRIITALYSLFCKNFLYIKKNKTNVPRLRKIADVVVTPRKTTCLCSMSQMCEVYHHQVFRVVSGYRRTLKYIHPTIKEAKRLILRLILLTQKNSGMRENIVRNQRFSIVIERMRRIRESAGKKQKFQNLFC